MLILINWCLQNVVFNIASVEWSKISPEKFSFPLPFNALILLGKPSSSYWLFSSFYSSVFHFSFCKIPSAHIMDSLLMGINQMKPLIYAINYNFWKQTLKYKLITNLVRTSILKLGLVNFDICRISEYENDVTFTYNSYILACSKTIFIL